MKRIVICLMAICLSLGASAQDFKPESSPTPKPNVIVKPKKVSAFLGIKAQGLYCMPSESGDLNTGASAFFGYGGGAALSLRFGNRGINTYATDGIFGVQIEAMYAHYSMETYSEDISLQGYEIPVLLQWWPTSSFGIEIGPTFSGVISSEDNVISSDSKTDYYVGDLKPYDVKLTVGAELKLKGGFSASIRYNLGTSKMAGNFNMKCNTLAIGIGYLFNIAK